MAVQTNGYLTEIGDQILVIPTNQPYVGVSGITSFTDSVSNTDTQRFFTKEFRYSTDGFQFTEFEELNESNLQAVTLNSKDPFYIQYRYTRSGTDATSHLKFNSITINLTTVDITCGVAYEASIFNSFFACSDQKVIGWCVNVLEKIYKQGIVPKYIFRGDDSEDDRNYIEFWRAICCYFSYFVQYARVFEDFDQNERILRQYLLSRDVYLCGNETLLALQNIAKGLVQNFRKRGTILAFEEEIKRLICFNSTDEYVVQVNNYSDWILDESSPNFDENRVVKAYEDKPGISSLTPYPILENTPGLVGFSDSSKTLLFLPGSGLGHIDPEGSQDQFNRDNFSFNIDPNQTYLFHIRFQQLGGTDYDNISFGVTSFDENNNEYLPISVVNGVTNRWFFLNEELPIKNQYYEFFALLLPSSTPTNANSIPQIGFGQNLKMDERTNKAVILLNNDSSRGNGNLQVEELKVYLLNNDVRGYFDASPTIEFFAKNNNLMLSNDSITEIIKNKFITYNLNFETKWLS